MICFVIIYNKVCVLVWIELEGTIFEKRKMFEIDPFDSFILYQLIVLSQFQC